MQVLSAFCTMRVRILLYNLGSGISWSLQCNSLSDVRSSVTEIINLELLFTVCFLCSIQHLNQIKLLPLFLPFSVQITEFCQIRLLFVAQEDKNSSSLVTNSYTAVIKLTDV